jgi:hypothetical protein
LRCRRALPPGADSASARLLTSHVVPVGPARCMLRRPCKQAESNTSPLVVLKVLTITNDAQQRDTDAYARVRTCREIGDRCQGLALLAVRLLIVLFVVLEVHLYLHALLQVRRCPMLVWARGGRPVLQSTHGRRASVRLLLSPRYAVTSQFKAI